jgi:hypothetical protein
VPASVEVDTSRLVAGMRQLAAGLTRAGPRVGLAQASDTARAIRVAVPVRSGALRATVRSSPESDGAAVHYGGSLPYADYIEGREHMVEDATDGAEHDFHRRMESAAETEVRKL